MKRRCHGIGFTSRTNFNPLIFANRLTHLKDLRHQPSICSPLGWQINHKTIRYSDAQHLHIHYFPEVSMKWASVLTVLNTDAELTEYNQCSINWEGDPQTNLSYRILLCAEWRPSLQPENKELKNATFLSHGRQQKVSCFTVLFFVQLVSQL